LQLSLNSADEGAPCDLYITVALVFVGAFGWLFASATDSHPGAAPARSICLTRWAALFRLSLRVEVKG